MPIVVQIYLFRDRCTKSKRLLLTNVFLMRVTLCLLLAAQTRRSMESPRAKPIRRLPPGRLEQESTSSHLVCQDFILGIIKADLENCNANPEFDLDTAPVVSFDARYTSFAKLSSVIFQCRVTTDFCGYSQAVLQESIRGYHQMRCPSTLVVWIEEPYSVEESHAICITEEELNKKFDRMRAEEALSYKLKELTVSPKSRFASEVRSFHEGSPRQIHCVDSDGGSSTPKYHVLLSRNLHSKP